MHVRAGDDQWRASGVVELPVGLPPSIQTRKEGIVWKIVVAVSLPGMPKWIRDIPLAVHQVRLVADDTEQSRGPVALDV
jgi:hypothetical protein